MYTSQSASIDPPQYKAILRWHTQAALERVIPIVIPPTRLLYAAAGAKLKHVWQCEECGETSSQWTGKCKSCDEWNT